MLTLLYKPYRCINQDASDYRFTRVPCVSGRYKKPFDQTQR